MCNRKNGSSKPSQQKLYVCVCVLVCVSVRNERATIQVENEHFIYLKARIVRRKYYMIKCADFTHCVPTRDRQNNMQSALIF